MLAKTSIPVSRQLNKADTAISNALASADILRRLTENGYNAARIGEGQKLFQAASLAVKAHTALVEARRDREAASGKITKNAYEAYRSLSDVVRKIWLDDKDQLATLGITDQLPQTITGFLEAAINLFDAPLKDREFMEVLDGLGYPELLLAGERSKIESLEELIRAREGSEDDIRKADQEQQQALKTLNEWMDRFIKKARVALRNKKDYLDKLGLLERSPKTEAPRSSQGPRQAKRG